MRTETARPDRIARPSSETSDDEALDVLVITRTSLLKACAKALDAGADEHPLSVKIISCDRLAQETPEAMLDAIAMQVRRLRQAGIVTDHTRILLKLPGGYEDGRLLASARKNGLRLNVADLCARIRSAGTKPWAGTIHVACDGAELAREDFLSHAGATILHAGKQRIGLTQRQQTLSRLAEAWREEKRHADRKLDATAEFRLVARVSGESSSLVAGKKIAIAEPSLHSLADDNERLPSASPLAAARNHALDELRQGSAEKFGELLINNQQLAKDALFLDAARTCVTGLHIACDFGKKLATLIRCRAFEGIKGWKEALLLAACKKGNAAIADLMICRHGARIDCRDASGLTPLQMAAGNGDEALAALLLKYGADPKKAGRGLFGKSPARIAREAGHWRVARLIDAAILEGKLKKRGRLDEEIDLLSGDETESRIRDYLTRPDHHLDHLDAYMMRDDRFAERISHGSAGQAKLARRRALALKIAATAGNPDMMKILIGIGVPVDKKISGGRTALHYVARAGDMAMVRLLLEQKADPELRSDAGSTALDYAIRSGSPEVVELLLKHGARITRQNWFSRKTIERFAAKKWLARSGLRSLVIDQLSAYAKTFGDDRVLKVLADCLPPRTKLYGEDAEALRPIIRKWPDSASARKLISMLPKVSPDGSEELSTSSSEGNDAADDPEQPSDH